MLLCKGHPVEEAEMPVGHGVPLDSPENCAMNSLSLPGKLSASAHNHRPTTHDSHFDAEFISELPLRKDYADGTLRTQAALLRHGPLHGHRVLVLLTLIQEHLLPSLLLGTQLCLPGRLLRLMLSLSLPVQKAEVQSVCAGPSEPPLHTELRTLAMAIGARLALNEEVPGPENCPEAALVLAQDPGLQKTFHGTPGGGPELRHALSVLLALLLANAPFNREKVVEFSRLSVEHIEPGQVHRLNPEPHSGCKEDCPAGRRASQETFAPESGQVAPG
mmetsp:Transcript_24103/g.53419  ORF Transcript_24103/g.53419 Transcript_24103/m.53419 type:complete len:275 (-) Transcript_24103:1182-2006(-)